ncbi:MAG: hypothetical protein ACE5JC_09395, partial [Candidatus Zixiibacteriota bacterium]
MFGTISLILGLTTLVVSALYYLRLAGGHPKALRVARIFYYLSATFITLASLHLFSLFLGDRFEYGYVAGYSSTDLSLLLK